MTLDMWFAFILASSALLILPGPTVILVVSYALGRGRSTAWATIPGVLLGDLTSMTASLLGAGAILAASASLFTLLKWIGACYLIWMGIKLWRKASSTLTLDPVKAGESRRKMFLNAYLVTALNPKGIVFFVAFVPQFVDPALPALAQFALLEATFLGCVAIIVTSWAVLAGSLAKRLTNPAHMKHSQRLSGAFMIGAGLMTATLSRTG